jgi:ribonuclease Z
MAADGRMGRRVVLRAASVGSAATLAAPALGRAQQSAPSGSITVTLLGTGTPGLNPARFGPATLVEAGGLRLLFDAGRGCTIRLGQLRIPLGSLGGVFLTHYHSDHVNGLPDLWMTGYIPTTYAGRRTPLRIWGPTGLNHLAERMRSAFADDIRIRMADEKVPEAATAIEAHEFPEAGGRVFEEAGVVVTAFPVDHGALIHPSVGYRIDHAGRAVLLSGDTKYDETVIRHGRGVDLLVHEVCAIPDAVLRDDPAAVAIAAHHTSPEEAGRVFAAAKPRLAAFSHFVLTTRPPVPPVSAEQIEAETRRSYDGPLVLGEDLTRFLLTDAGIQVRRWDAARQAYPG